MEIYNYGAIMILNNIRTMRIPLYCCTKQFGCQYVNSGTDVICPEIAIGENIDGSVQHCSISGALVMEMLQSCTKPPILEHLHLVSITNTVMIQEVPLPS